MSKSVLISIQPKWCEKILNGEKTVEVRKTKPKVDVPFKCYIYETKAINKNKLVIDLYGDLPAEYARGCGKVIGEFVCDKIMLAEYESLYGYIGFNTEWSPNDDCLTNTERLDYGFGKEFIYGWHISNLKIYDKPKELREFRTICKYGDDYPCQICKKSKYDENNILYCDDALKRPPQSWCYVTQSRYYAEETE